MTTFYQIIRYKKGWLMHVKKGILMIKGKVALIFRVLCSKSPRLSSLYYRLFSGEFSREQQVVLRGMSAYDQVSGGRFLLRRNIHRLEKGLVMKNRKPVFAVGYIEETTKRYVQEATSTIAEFDRELGWCHDVLRLYFKQVASHPIVDRARTMFEAQVELDLAAKEELNVPYIRNLKEEPPVECEALLELAKMRRSVRWFQKKAVPDTLVHRAMEVALLSPSACNRIPFRFHFATDLAVAPIVSRVAWGTAGFADNIPAVAVVIGRFGAFCSERDRHLPYTDSSLAIMSFIYALETLGLGSCCINWPDIKGVDAQMKEIINLFDDERVIMLIAFGFPDPDGLVAYSQKKSVSDVCTFN